MASAKGITPVDRQEVFAKLEKILATVKLQPAARYRKDSRRRLRMHPQQLATDSPAKTPEQARIPRAVGCVLASE